MTSLFGAALSLGSIVGDTLVDGVEVGLDVGILLGFELTEGRIDGLDDGKLLGIELADGADDGLDDSVGVELVEGLDDGNVLSEGALLTVGDPDGKVDALGDAISKFSVVELKDEAPSINVSFPENGIFPKFDALSVELNCGESSVDVVVDAFCAVEFVAVFSVGESVAVRFPEGGLENSLEGLEDGSLELMLGKEDDSAEGIDVSAVGDDVCAKDGSPEGTMVGLEGFDDFGFDVGAKDGSLEGTMVGPVEGFEDVSVVLRLGFDVAIEGGIDGHLVGRDEGRDEGDEEIIFSEAPIL